MHAGGDHPLPGGKGHGDHRQLPRANRTTVSTVWMRRFESETERERLYKAVYESEHWKNVIAPKVTELIDRSAINVQRIVPTRLSTAQ